MVKYIFGLIYISLTWYDLKVETKYTDRFFLKTIEENF